MVMVRLRPRPSKWLPGLAWVLGTPFTPAVPNAVAELTELVTDGWPTGWMLLPDGDAVRPPEKCSRESFQVCNKL